MNTQLNLNHIEKLENQVISTASHQKKLHDNIKKNYLFTFSTSIALTESIWMLFLAYRGMSLVQIGLLESIFHITSLAMELPTGIIADRFGRKNSRIASRIMALVSTLFMIASHSFWGFCIAFILTAISYNLESGAGDALIYDSLVETETADTYMKIKGRQEVCFRFARIGSLVLGGFVSMISYELAYTLTLGLHGMTILQALWFTEPTIGKRSKVELPQNLHLHIKESLQTIWAHKHIMPYILYIEMFSLFYTTLYFYLQNAIKAQGHTEGYIGLVLGASAVFSLVSSAKAHHLAKIFGQRKLIWIGSTSALVFFGIIAFTPYASMGFMGIALIDGLLYVTFCDYINQLIPSTHRATLLSFQAMIFSALMIVFFPVFGAISQHYGFSLAFQMLFLIALPTMVWTLFKLDKVFKEMKH